MTRSQLFSLLATNPLRSGWSTMNSIAPRLRRLMKRAASGERYVQLGISKRTQTAVRQFSSGDWRLCPKSVWNRQLELSAVSMPARRSQGPAPFAAPRKALPNEDLRGPGRMDSHRTELL